MPSSIESAPLVAKYSYTFELDGLQNLTTEIFSSLVRKSKAIKFAERSYFLE